MPADQVAPPQYPGVGNIPAKKNPQAAARLLAQVTGPSGSEQIGDMPGAPTMADFARMRLDQDEQKKVAAAGQTVGNSKAKVPFTAS